MFRVRACDAARKTVLVSLALASFGALSALAFGGTGPAWILGSSAAVGKKAHTHLLVTHVPAMYVGMATDKPRLIKRVSVQVFAKPRQRATAGYVLNCD